MDMGISQSDIADASEGRAAVNGADAGVAGAGDKAGSVSRRRMRTYLPPERIACLTHIAAIEAGVQVERVRARGRLRRVVQARHVARWLVRELCPTASLAQIGRVIAGHHSTSIHSDYRCRAEVAAGIGPLAELANLCLPKAQSALAAFGRGESVTLEWRETETPQVRSRVRAAKPKVGKRKAGKVPFRQGKMPSGSLTADGAIVANPWLWV